MARVIPKEVQRQLDGIASMVAHAERLYRQGILSSDELEQRAPTQSSSGSVL